jgi:ADP-ribosylglycohydrolase
MKVMPYITPEMVEAGRKAFEAGGDADAVVVAIFVAMTNASGGTQAIDLTAAEAPLIIEQDGQSFIWMDDIQRD